MKSSFAGIGALALAATPLCAIPLALPSTAAQAQPEQVVKATMTMDHEKRDLFPKEKVAQ